MNDDKVKLGVLWKNVSQKGNKTYLSGRLNNESFDAAIDLLRDGGRFLVLGNNKRPDKQDPDYTLFVVPGRGENDGAAAPPPPSTRPAQPSRSEPPQRTYAGTRSGR